MKSPIRSVVLFTALLHLSPVVNAFEYKTTFYVGPNDNGKQWIRNELMVGDTMKVTIAARRDYKLVSAQVADGNGLSWSKEVFTFTSSPVPATMAKDTRMEAKWDGELQPDSKGGGKGTIKNLPWSLTGVYMLLGEHEGVGSDKERTPPGTLKSEDPSGNQPTFKPGITYDEVNRKYIGIFKVEDKLGNGVYAGTPYGTARPCSLGTEIKDCPDCNKTKVPFAYLGCEGTIGGKVLGDTIEIGTYTADPELSSKKIERDTLAPEIVALEVSVNAEAAKLIDFNAQLTTAEANLDAAIDQFVLVHTEFERKAVTDAKKAVEKKEGEIAALYARLETIPKPSPATRAVILNDIRKAENTLKTLRAALATAEAALKTAQETQKQNAKNEYAINRLLDLVAGLTVQVLELELVLALDNSRLDSLKTNHQTVVERIAFLEGLEKDWKNYIPTIILHELDHRKICYSFRDEITVMLNTLRVYGYAADAGTAENLARDHFQNVLKRGIEDIQDACKKKQNKYDDNPKY